MRLDALFRATKAIDLPGGQKGMVRALSDAEQKERQYYALQKSYEAEKEIRKSGSIAHQAVLAPVMAVDEPSTLIPVILEARRLDVEREALILFPHRFIPLPDGPDDVKQREVLEQRETSEAETFDKRKAHTEQRMAEIQSKMEAAPPDDLRQMTESLAVTVEARRIMIRAIRCYTVYAGVLIHDEKDKLKRLFQSPEQVSDVPAMVINRLFDEVEAVNSVDPWDIEKNA